MISEIIFFDLIPSFLTSLMIIYVENDGVEYSLYEDTKTASIIKALKSNIFIPKSIIFNSQEYIVTDFLSIFFIFQCIVKSIEFAANSEMNKINKKNFFLFAS